MDLELQDCWMCNHQFSVEHGKHLDHNREVHKLLDDHLDCNEFNGQDGKVCPQCFSSYQELCVHQTQLLKVQEAIQKVIMQIKTRRKPKHGGNCVRTRRSTRNGSSVRSNTPTPPDLPKSIVFEEPTNQDIQTTEKQINSIQPVEIKKEKLESSDGEDYSLDTTEFFQIAEESGEIKGEDFDENSADSDETREFILSQVLSESESSDSQSESSDSQSESSDSQSESSDSQSESSDSQSESSDSQSESDSKSSTPSNSKRTKTPKRRPPKIPAVPKQKECELCGPSKTFPSTATLSKHYEMDHRDTEQPFFCEILGCNEKLLTPDLLEIHRRHYHDTLEAEGIAGSPQLHRSFCNHCRLSSYFPEYLRHHELQEHSDLLKHSCPTCGAKFLTEDILNIHKLGHSTGSPAILECSLCPSEWKFQFQTSQILDSHLIRIHNFPRLSRCMEARRMPTTPKTSEEFPCDKCGRLFLKSTPHSFLDHKCAKYQSPFQCELCSKRYVNNCELLKHTEKVHERLPNQPRSHTCPKCSKQFTTTLMYKRHMNCHNLENKLHFHCTQCEARFASDKLLADHKQANHIRCSLKNQIRCELCSKRFYTTFIKWRHQREVHPEIFIHRCTQCDDATFSKLEFLQVHLKTHEASGPYTCKLCPRQSYLTGDHLEVHLKEIHTVGIGKICAECGAVFPDSTKLTLHMNSEHGESLPFQCSECGRQFSSKDNLRKHTRQVHPTEEAKRKRKELETKLRVQCEICQKWSVNKRALHLHVRSVHERSTVQVCEVCGKSINGASAMKDHMKIHREEKNFACDFCDKRFVRRDALRMHTYTHTGEKPFGCYICDKRFNQRTPLKRHVELHKKDGSWFPKPNAVEQEESSNSMQQD